MIDEDEWKFSTHYQLERKKDFKLGGKKNQEANDNASRYFPYLKRNHLPRDIFIKGVYIYRMCKAMPPVPLVTRMYVEHKIYISKSVSIKGSYYCYTSFYAVVQVNDRSEPPLARRSFSSYYSISLLFYIERRMGNEKKNKKTKTKKMVKKLVEEYSSGSTMCLLQNQKENRNKKVMRARISWIEVNFEYGDVRIPYHTCILILFLSKGKLYRMFQLSLVPPADLAIQKIFTPANPSESAIAEHGINTIRIWLINALFFANSLNRKRIVLPLTKHAYSLQSITY